MNTQAFYTLLNRPGLPVLYAFRDLASLEAHLPQPCQLQPNKASALLAGVG